MSPCLRGCPMPPRSRPCTGTERPRPMDRVPRGRRRLHQSRRAQRQLPLHRSQSHRHLRFAHSHHPPARRGHCRTRRSAQGLAQRLDRDHLSSRPRPSHGRSHGRTRRPRADRSAATCARDVELLDWRGQGLGSGLLRRPYAAHAQGGPAQRDHLQPGSRQRLRHSAQPGPLQPWRHPGQRPPVRFVDSRDSTLRAPSNFSSRATTSTAPSTSPHPIRSPTASSWPFCARLGEYPTGSPRRRR